MNQDYDAAGSNAGERMLAGVAQSEHFNTAAAHQVMRAREMNGFDPLTGAPSASRLDAAEFGPIERAASPQGPIAQGLQWALRLAAGACALVATLALASHANLALERGGGGLSRWAADASMLGSRPRPASSYGALAAQMSAKEALATAKASKAALLKNQPPSFFPKLAAVYDCGLNDACVAEARSLDPSAPGLIAGEARRFLWHRASFATQAEGAAFVLDFCSYGLAAAPSQASYSQELAICEALLSRAPAQTQGPAQAWLDRASGSWSSRVVRLLARSWF
jgi:hypothetical protein